MHSGQETQVYQRGNVELILRKNHKLYTPGLIFILFLPTNTHYDRFHNLLF
jgi:hypothetical protein